MSPLWTCFFNVVTWWWRCCKNKQRVPYESLPCVSVSCSGRRGLPALTAKAPAPLPDLPPVHEQSHLWPSSPEGGFTPSCWSTSCLSDWGETHTFPRSSFLFVAPPPLSSPFCVLPSSSLVAQHFQELIQGQRQSASCLKRAVFSG